MINLEKLGFDNWFWKSIPSGKDKVDLSKTNSIKIVRVINIKKTTKGSGGPSRQSLGRGGLVISFLIKNRVKHN